MKQETKQKLIKFGIPALCLTLFSVWLIHFCITKKENDAVNEQIDKITKNIVCVEIGSMGMFGFNKGIEGAKKCQTALERRKFYRGDFVRVTKHENKELLWCKGYISSWSFDPDDLKATYNLEKVTCNSQPSDSIKVYEDGLEIVR